MAVNENVYQGWLVRHIRNAFGNIGVDVIKNDPGIIQGFPDLTVFYNGKFVLLEVKKSKNASHRPNQDHYIRKYANYGCGWFIYPENEDDVMEEVCIYLGLDYRQWQETNR